MKLYFVRHGETTMNEAGRISGWLSDPDLTDAGEKQAAVVGEKLRQRNIDAIFGGDLARTQQTAQIIRDIINPEIPIYMDWPLRERWHGEKENRPWNEMNWEKINQKDIDYTAQHDIELHNIMARTQAFLGNLQLLPIRYSNVAVITSGGIMFEVAKILQPDFDNYDTGNAEIREYDLDELLKGLSKI